MDLIDYDGASKILPLATQTLRTYVSKGKIPYFKIGKRVFFKPEELEAWIDSRHVPAQEVSENEK